MSILESFKAYEDQRQAWIAEATSQRMAEVETLEEATKEVTFSIVKNLNVKTEENEAVFWTGHTLENQRTAMAYAREQGKKSIEMTRDGKILDQLGMYKPDSPIFNNGESKLGNLLFDAASRKFAQGASGNITAVIYQPQTPEQQAAYQRSAYARIEEPILLRREAFGEKVNLKQGRVEVPVDITLPALKEQIKENQKKTRGLQLVGTIANRAAVGALSEKEINIFEDVLKYPNNSSLPEKFSAPNNTLPPKKQLTLLERLATAEQAYKKLEAKRQAAHELSYLSFHDWKLPFVGNEKIENSRNKEEAIVKAPNEAQASELIKSWSQAVAAYEAAVAKEKEAGLENPKWKIDLEHAQVKQTFWKIKLDELQHAREEAKAAALGQQSKTLEQKVQLEIFQRKAREAQQASEKASQKVKRYSWDNNTDYASKAAVSAWQKVSFYWILAAKNLEEGADPSLLEEAAVEASRASQWYEESTQDDKGQTQNWKLSSAASISLKSAEAKAEAAFWKTKQQEAHSKKAAVEVQIWKEVIQLALQTSEVYEEEMKQAIAGKGHGNLEHTARSTLESAEAKAEAALWTAKQQEAWNKRADTIQDWEEVIKLASKASELYEQAAKQFSARDDLHHDGGFNLEDAALSTLESAKARVEIILWKVNQQQAGSKGDNAEVSAWEEAFQLALKASKF